ncbi:Rv1733c family protein [Streptomyces jumonjinensis]|uniref:Uncharacterized protein n=1 Tax=Streptomyces jumonjinensis TaxID=1945 RepID=A0A646KDA5_STRJU|nr:hypothetical protein [Streptomyces jumonjinensis]MQT00071.1 hypothetical protein [Streptomyces jumonjinensis]
MRTAAGVWRWRGNPLRRTTDLAEAWTALVAVLLLVVAAPAVGWFTGSGAGDALRRSMLQQRQERHPVVATVLRHTPPRRPPAHDPESSAAREKRHTVVATWTGVDGDRHTGRVTTRLRDPRTGDQLTVWIDRSGRPAGPPLDEAAVGTRAVLAGLGAAFAFAGLTEAARRLALARLSRRRQARLERAWAALGPDWGRTGAGG